MAKQPRHQSVVSRQSDAENNDNHWLRRFEETLQKTSVQPRGQSTYDQISSIMNTKSKYTSVENAVENMMDRSGLKLYLDNVKNSKEELPAQSKKIAQQVPTVETKKDTSVGKEPQIIQEKPSIARTLDNLIRESKGNLPIPAIIAKLHALHARDIADEGSWDDERLIRLVSQLNLQAKKDNPSNYENYDQLGKGDHSNDADIDSSNTDAFLALQPATI
jgi:hypothetical protein